MQRWAVMLFVIACLATPDTGAAQIPPCRVASDPEFGYTRDKPIPTGGGVFFGSSRQKQYLSVLRGPAGQQVSTVGGVGSAPQGPESKVIIDSYAITYEGLAKPITLYLNMYAFDTPQVPQGFTCGESPSAALGPPPPDPAAAASVLRAYAYADGITRPIAPIAFADALGARRALVFDFFNLASARARSDASRGTVPPQDLPPAMLIVADPLTCNKVAMTAASIEVVLPQGQTAPRMPQLSSGPQLANMVSGASLPDGAVGALFPFPSLPAAGNIRITYPKAEGCTELPQEVALPFRPQPARYLASDQPALPAGTVDPDPSVFLHAVVDVDGAFRQPLYMAGPQSLMDAATEAIKSWKAAPAVINGEPVVSVITLRVGFK